MNEIEGLRAHYVSRVSGEPQYVEMHAKSGLTARFFHWAKENNRLDVDFYASAGASHYGPDTRKHAVEVFTGVSSGWDAVREAFADLTLNILRNDWVPHHASFVSGKARIIKGLPFTGWVLTERPDDFMPELRFDDGRHIVFLDAIPIFDEEAQYLHQNRADDLFEIWEDTGMDSWDLDRKLPPLIEARPRMPWQERITGLLKRER